MMICLPSLLMCCFFFLQSKQKKMKEKYKYQDDEDKELMQQILRVGLHFVFCVVP